jgi:hypothetical protein
MISIKNTKHPISIVNNTFTNNTIIKGVIYLDNEHRERPILIANNTF